MSISIELIKNLRDQSGVSITACKKALEEANGDIDAAFDLLRKKGEAKAKERSERATTEGVVAITSSADKTSYVVIGCETDFVSKNEDFVSAVNEFSSQLLSGSEVQESAVSDLGLKMGENVVLKDSGVLDSGVIGSYVHSNNKNWCCCCIRWW
jgi:elongation factor Ts